MSQMPFHQRIDTSSPTWRAMEEFLNQNIKTLQEALEVPRDTGLERVDQGRIAMCRDLLGAARPPRPENERGPEAGTDYGLQGLAIGPRI